MDHVASILGLPQPLSKGPLRDRNTTHLRRRCSTDYQTEYDCIQFGEFSKTLCAAQNVPDDETLSSVSSFDDSLSSNNSVSFAPTLVTHVYERPFTSYAEKRRLYYSDADYRAFRNDCLQEPEPRDSVVHFAPQVVSNVYTYTLPLDKETLYYSDRDLQR